MPACYLGSTRWGLCPPYGFHPPATYLLGYLHLPPGIPLPGIPALLQAAWALPRYLSGTHRAGGSLPPACLPGAACHCRPAWLPPLLHLLPAGTPLYSWDSIITLPADSTTWRFTSCYLLCLPPPLPQEDGTASFYWDTALSLRTRTAPPGAWDRRWAGVGGLKPPRWEFWSTAAPHLFSPSPHSGPGSYHLGRILYHTTGTGCHTFYPTYHYTRVLTCTWVHPLFGLPPPLPR